MAEVRRLLAPYFIDVRGQQHVAVDRDPFILVGNHNVASEALVLLSHLSSQRGGVPVHFAADWPVALYPVAGWLIAGCQPVWVTRKSARFRMLNVLRPFFRSGRAPLAQLADYLRSGRSIGIFPEGTMNPDANHLLPMSWAPFMLAARHSVPVVPMRIRFPEIAGARRIPGGARMELIFDEPCTSGSAGSFVGKLSRKDTRLVGTYTMPDSSQGKATLFRQALKKPGLPKLVSIDSDNLAIGETKSFTITGKRFNGAVVPTVSGPAIEVTSFDLQGKTLTVTLSATASANSGGAVGINVLDRAGRSAKKSLSIEIQ